MPSDYRLSKPLVARMMGLLLAAMGVGVLLLTVAVAVFALPLVVLTVGCALAVAAGLGLGVMMARRPVVVRMDDVGYQVRYIRGAGVKRARWKDVEDAVATTVASERCVVLRLRDGGTTTVPVRVLAKSPDEFVKDLQAHLEQGHGYRPIG